MRIADWILLATFAFAWYGVGNVWLVQTVAWPLFGYVGQKEFEAYHQRWWDGIKTVILIPGGLAFVGGIALLVFRPAGVSASLIWAGVAVEGVVYVLTAVWYGPQQSRMHDTRLSIFNALNRTNWIRTALLTIYALIVLQAVIQRLGTITTG